MQAALAPRGDARTFLTHFVGDGLEDDRYVVETYRSYVAQRIMLRRRRISFSGSDTAIIAAT